ncbi:hypothetical protein BH11ARM1_BH11ARM1_02030 [soil metagenome]
MVSRTLKGIAITSLLTLSIAASANSFQLLMSTNGDASVLEFAGDCKTVTGSWTVRGLPKDADGYAVGQMGVSDTGVDVAFQIGDRVAIYRYAADNSQPSRVVRVKVDGRLVGFGNLDDGSRNLLVTQLPNKRFVSYDFDNNLSGKTEISRYEPPVSIANYAVGIDHNTLMLTQEAKPYKLAYSIYSGGESVYMTGIYNPVFDKTNYPDQGFHWDMANDRVAGMMYGYKTGVAVSHAPGRPQPTWLLGTDIHSQLYKLSDKVYSPLPRRYQVKACGSITKNF